jgi:hypothetical protein
MNESVIAMMHDNKGNYKFVETFISLYDSDQLSTIVMIIQREIRKRNIASINNECKSVV